jgi:hypothetical protein
VSRTAAISNIEKGLQVVYRGGVSHPNVPSADQIYRGETSKVASLVREIFEAFVMKRVRSQAGSTMRWVAATVAHYDAYFPPLAPAACRYPYAGAWSRLRSGTLLACVLHFFCGDRDDDGANLPAVRSFLFFVCSRQSFFVLIFPLLFPTRRCPSPPSSSILSCSPGSTLRTTWRLLRRCTTFDFCSATCNSLAFRLSGTCVALCPGASLACCRVSARYRARSHASHPDIRTCMHADVRACTHTSPFCPSLPTHYLCRSRRLCRCPTKIFCCSNSTT